jgi:hypothetical protein
MIKEKVQAIIDQVCQLTTSGDLEWTITTSTKWTKMLKAVAEDGTKYEIEIKWSLINDKFEMEKSYLFIRNESLPGGLYCCNHVIFDTITLRDLLVDKYCQDLSPSAEDLCDAFDKICIGMNKAVWRDSQINNIIN